MRRLSIVAAGASLLLAISVPVIEILKADPNTADNRSVVKPKTTQVDWKRDPVCRMVFFAVLEGLYEDGVPGDVVDSIVPRKVGKGKHRMKTSFVFSCPLCHPVYEAFRAYQQRPGFSATPDSNTFGKAFDAKTAKLLKSAKPGTRLKALAPLVQKWTKRRLEMMRLSKAEAEQWNRKLAAHARTGKGFLLAYLGKDEAYKGWSPYWGCAACNGTTWAAGEVLKEARPKTTKKK